VPDDPETTDDPIFPHTRPPVTGTHSHFTIHLTFPEDDIDDQYILMHSALMVPDLESQLGAYLDIASAALYVCELTDLN
jgi:hypothetical protein